MEGGEGLSAPPKVSTQFVHDPEESMKFTDERELLADLVFLIRRVLHAGHAGQRCNHAECNLRTWRIHHPDYTE